MISDISFDSQLSLIVVSVLWWSLLRSQVVNFYPNPVLTDVIVYPKRLSDFVLFISTEMQTLCT